VHSHSVAAQLEGLAANLDALVAGAHELHLDPARTCTRHRAMYEPAQTRPPSHGTAALWMHPDSVAMKDHVIRIM
jgi:hypothetical protein